VGVPSGRRTVTTTLAWRHKINRGPDRVDAALARFDLRAGAAAVWSVVEEGNRTVTRERPWELSADDQRRYDVLATLVHTCRTVATEIGPFLPDASARLWERSAVSPTFAGAPRYSLASPQADARAAESTCFGVASSPCTRL
jgi:methionyl-tRNA synthetase